MLTGSPLQPRTRAREWLEQVELGIDPRHRERTETLQRQRERQTTFSIVAEAWLASIGNQRKAVEVRADVRREFVGPWRDRPITGITTVDVATIIRNKRDVGHAAQARNLLGYVKRLFDWAVSQHAFGITESPAAALSAVKLIGKKNIRKRVLSDHELGEVWDAADEIPFPYGPLIRMLILTGQRRSEVAEAKWSEFDMNGKVWIIPAERMKMMDAHVVPLAADTLALLQSLPRFTGDYLFSSTGGRTPVTGFSRAKDKIHELAPLATPWVLHDLRRTMRTGLSALPIPENVRELMIAHAQPGLKRTYDLHSYRDEKRRGFALWEAHLRGIVQPELSNVVSLHG